MNAYQKQIIWNLHTNKISSSPTVEQYEQEHMHWNERSINALNGMSNPFGTSSILSL